MKWWLSLISICLLCISTCAQETFDGVPKETPDTLYFGFHDGVQLIIIDNFDAHRRYGSWMDSMFPRGGSWFLLNGPPLKNVYIFRDSEGKIIRRYNSESVDETGFKGTTFINTDELTLNSILDYVELKNHLMYFDDNGKVGLINLKGEIVVPAKYDEIRKFQKSRGKVDKLVVVSGKRFGLLDSNLKVVFPPIYRADIDSSYGGYPEHSLIDGENLMVFLNDKCGLINDEGKVLIDFLYEEIRLIHDGMYIGLNFRSEGEVGHYIASYKDAGYQVESCVIFDSSLHVLTKLENYEFIKYSGIKSFIVKRNNKFGIVDPLGNTLVPLEYDALSEWSGVYYVSKGGKKGLVNLDGKLVIPCEYEYIDFRGPVIYVSQNGLMGLYNSKFELIAKPQFEQITQEGTKFILTRRDGSKGFVNDENGNSYYQSPEGEIIKL